MLRYMHTVYIGRKVKARHKKHFVLYRRKTNYYITYLKTNLKVRMARTKLEYTGKKFRYRESNPGLLGESQVS